MKKGTTKNATLKRLSVIILLLGIFAFLVVFLYQYVLINHGKSFISWSVMITTLLLIINYVLIWGLRLNLRNKVNDKTLRVKLKKYRRWANYFILFLIVVMFYHFWEKEKVWVLVVLSVLLIDRLNVITYSE